MSNCGIKHVDFEYYCGRCANKDLTEWEDPCNECLHTPARVDSRKPINYKSVISASFKFA